MKFNWVDTRTGERLSEVHIKHTVDRNALQAGVWNAVVKALNESEYIDRDDVIQALSKVSRTAAEKGLRDFLFDRGNAGLEFWSEHISLYSEDGIDPYDDFLDLDGVVDRLFPETIKKAVNA